MVKLELFRRHAMYWMAGYRMSVPQYAIIEGRRIDLQNASPEEEEIVLASGNEAAIEALKYAPNWWKKWKVLK